MSYIINTYGVQKAREELVQATWNYTNAYRARMLRGCPTISTMEKVLEAANLMEDAALNLLNELSGAQ